MRFALLAMLALTAPADAKPKPPAKPSAAETRAKQVAADWLAAMHLGGDAKLDGAVSLTASPVFVAAYDDEHDLCPVGSSKDLAKTLACLHDKLEPHGTPKLSKKSGANIGGPLAKHAKQLADLKKTATLVEIDDGCDGSEHQLLLAVDGKQRIVAVLYQAIACTE